MTASRPEPPQERYGRAPMSEATRHRVVMGLGALVTAGLIGGAAMLYQRFELVDVKGKMSAYEVLDDRTVAVTISVTRKDPSRPVVCIVRARSRDGSETGRREVVVGPSGDRTVQVTSEVTSYTRPYVGDIYGCGMEVPPYLLHTG